MENEKIKFSHLYGVPHSAEALILSELLKGGTAPIIHICHHDRERETLAQAARFFLPETNIYELPAWDCQPYDRSSPHPDVLAARIATLFAITQPQEKPYLLITTASALIQFLPPSDWISKSCFTISSGTRLGRDKLQKFLGEHGYVRVGKVMEPGEYAMRGSIVDIFPCSYEQPCRIDLFAEDIESIKFFDPLSQRSEEEIQEISLYPAGEITLTAEHIQNFREGYRELFGAARNDDPLYAAISAGQHYSGMEHWLPLFYNKLDNILDYVPSARVTLTHQIWTTLEERSEVIKDYYQARLEHQEASRKLGEIRYNPLPPEKLYFSLAKLGALLNARQATEFMPFNGGENHADMGLRSGKNLFSLAKNANISPLEMLAQESANLLNAKKKLLLCCHSSGSLERLKHLLAEQHIKPATINNWLELKPGVALALLPIAQGFITPDAVIYGEADIFGQKLIRHQPRRKKNSEFFMGENSGFEQGELLVHVEHGIGRFDGLVTVEVNGNRHDCLKLLYLGEDRLFIPVENLDVLSRFGDGDGVELDKLGAGSWQARKARMKERIRMAAEELLKIAALRQMQPAPELVSPPGIYDSFCARFPYAETEDQERSINEVLEDLQSGRPMDRLVCGDVGFGKTEVALRAAFVAASAAETPSQVAVIAPTTLLARQHYQTFRDRFEGTGLRVARLSRLCSTKEARENKEGLKDGSVDVIVGTHALLSDQIKFANLGLVIVDEEQHFGVKQKEKLKALKENVHVLTLSATPIPRTLQMALTGVRELSLITTPPVDRLAIRSFVLPFDSVIIKEAINREIHRGGQVFYVAPRISDLNEIKIRLRELAPNARLAVAHGQIAAGELDTVMNDFYDGKYDILLSTAIIESGIDIPTANTMIIHRSDRFGLAQLYQLRGRVGRGKLRAYAYFTLEHQRNLSKDALKRLEVMQSLDSLGAGFTLASHDMDIRGFGNLVGEEQSGHIKEVGIELYQQMLEEAVKAARSQQQTEVKVTLEEDFSPQINMGLSILIPETYIEDLGLRLNFYRRLAAAKTGEEVDELKIEMNDRFGKMPDEVEHLLAILQLKSACRKAGVEKLDAGPKGIVLSFRAEKMSNPDKLIGHIARNSGRLKIRPDQKLLCSVNCETPELALKNARELIDELSKI